MGNNSPSALTVGASNRFGNPMLNTTTGFTITSRYSAAVDTASNYWGAGFNGKSWDIGWKESAFTVTNLKYYVRMLSPVNRWTNAITNAMSLATIRTIECYPNPFEFMESVRVNKKTNIVLEAYDWVNSRNDTTTIINSIGHTNCINITNSHKISILGFTIQNARQNGINIYNSASNKIIGNVMNNFVNSGYGCTYLYNSQSNTIASNSCNHDYFVFWLSNSSYNRINANQFTYGSFGNGQYGVKIEGASSSNIISANSINSYAYGVNIQSATKNNIYTNIFWNDGSSAIYTTGIEGSNLIIYNSFYSNVNGNIYITGSGGYDTIMHNRINGLTQYGNSVGIKIWFGAGTNTKIDRNAFYNNSDGIDDYVNNMDIINNDFYKDSGYALFCQGNSIRCYNNIFYSNATGVDSYFGVIEMGYNVFYGNVTSTNRYFDGVINVHNGNFFNINPLINTTNYALTIGGSASICIDSATNIPYVDTPFFGLARI